MTEAERIEKPKWTISKMFDQDVLMDNGVISSISTEEICESLNELIVIKEWREEEKIITEERIATINDLTAENERLQQQLKEKETERSYWLNLAHETQIELKSAQELIAKYTDIIHNLQRECIELRVANRKLIEAK